jgi:hypothetical protein
MKKRLHNILYLQDYRNKKQALQLDDSITKSYNLLEIMLIESMQKKMVQQQLSYQINQLLKTKQPDEDLQDFILIYRKNKNLIDKQLLALKAKLPPYIMKLRNLMLQAKHNQHFEKPCYQTHKNNFVKMMDDFNQIFYAHKHPRPSV